MNRIVVTASIAGINISKTYEFLVDVNAHAFLGLPQSEIDELGLTLLPLGKARLMTRDGVVELDRYIGIGNFRGQGFSSTVIAMPIPVLGFGLLESMRFRINPANDDVEQVPDDEIYPPIVFVASLF